MNQEQTNITTGKQIRHLRTQLGMTQEELAGELNVTRQALSNWERDVNEPDLNMLKKICFLFGVNMDDFAKEVITKMETYENNPLMYEFICKHKVAIEKLNYYEWAKFLEKVNDELLATKLLDKLDKSAKRSNLGIYRQILFDEFESRECFYCGKKLREKGIQVDHFIPWSFIKDDKLWNMVLACPSCNNGKRDKLATEPFLDKLLMRNKDIRLHYYNDTLELSRTIDIRAAEEMRNYGRVGLLKIYNYAQENGYDEQWQPMRHRNE